MNTNSLDASAKLGYLETTGRCSGQRRETEIWWIQDGAHIYLMSGGGLEKDWIRNFRKTPQVRFRVGEKWVSGIASILEDTGIEQRVRELMAEKYYAYTPGQGDELPNEWSKTALPVVITISS